MFLLGIYYLKRGLRRGQGSSGTGFLLGVLLTVQSWIETLWLSITGGVNLTAPDKKQNNYKTIFGTNYEHNR